MDKLRGHARKPGLQITQTSEKRSNLVYGLTGLCCMLVGLGIARFGYTPILPLMINYAWLNQLQAGHLGAVNFFGYFLGAVLARLCIHRYGSRNIIKFALATCVLSLFLCAFPLGFYWLTVWRLIAGFSGALLMVATPTLLFAHIPHKLKGRISGLMFSGIGFGIVLSGVLVPTVGKLGLSLTWLVLGAVTLGVSIFAWFNLPPTQPHHTSVDPTAAASATVNTNILVILLVISYFLYGIGFTPHTLFLVEYLTRYLHYSNAIGGLNWSLFGIGMVVGTIGTGFVADHIGITKCLFSAYILAILEVALILLTHNLIAVTGSSLVMGMLFLSIVSLSSTQLSQLISAQAYPALWGLMAALFALSQTMAAYFMSHLIQGGAEGYNLMFWVALTALFGAVVILLGLIRPKLVRALAVKCYRLN